jgi:hypothetical protein
VGAAQDRGEEGEMPKIEYVKLRDLIQKLTGFDPELQVWIEDEETGDLRTPKPRAAFFIFEGQPTDAVAL